MNLAALLDLGVPFDHLVRELANLPLEGYHIDVSTDSKNGIMGTRVDVVLDEKKHDHHHHGHHHHEHRTLTNIENLLAASTLSTNVIETSLKIFRLLANAEGKVHGMPPEEVHFHEVGAVDSIVDIVGAAICLDYLKPDSITSSLVELGSGTIRCQHGVMTVPAPATALLATGFPHGIGGTDHEATTPTGAAYIAAMVGTFSPRIQGICRAAGIGIGHRDSKCLPNILRVFLYETETNNASRESLLIQEENLEIHANIDDMTPEHLAFLAESLFEAGACDVWQEPIVMKKGRLATKVCSLLPPSRLDNVRDAFFRHSTTLGIRIRTVVKSALPRKKITVTTPWGTLPAKLAESPDGAIRLKPEYDACRDMAQDYHITLEQIRKEISRNESHDD